jgi:hypothetical protein
MAALWNRATPSQYRMLRAIAGAVRNAAHAHQIEMPNTFARSVAKRATGTLTAQWPDVLAATANRRQNSSRDNLTSRELRGSDLSRGPSKGDRLGLLRRSPLRFVWNHYAAGMWKIKREGTPEQYAAHVRVLKLLQEAQSAIDGLNQQQRKETNGR